MEKNIKFFTTEKIETIATFSFEKAHSMLEEEFFTTEDNREIETIATISHGLDKKSLGMIDESYIEAAIEQFISVCNSRDYTVNDDTIVIDLTDNLNTDLADKDDLTIEEFDLAVERYCEQWNTEFSAEFSAIRLAGGRVAFAIPEPEAYGIWDY